MRSPRPLLPLALAALVLVGSLSLPLLAGAAQAYGERAYASNTVLGTGDPYLEVYRDQMLAQSFTASTTYVLLNVTLRLENLLNNQNTLTITIRPNDAANNAPAATILASATVVEPPSVKGNYSIPVSPAPTLYAGQVYWIVAYNAAPSPANGYAWHYSNWDSYAGGWAASHNASSGPWVAYTAYDLFFVAFGRELAANLTAGMSVDRAFATPRDTVNFTVYVNNTGSQVAPMAWVNDSLSASFQFLSDTSGGGAFPSTTPFPSYTFANVTPGTHSFVVRVMVATGAVPGTAAVNRVSLSFANATGAMRSAPPATASVTIGLVHKQLYLAPGSSPVPATQKLTVVRPASSTPTVTPALGSGQSATFALSPALAKDFVALNVTVTLWVASQGGKTIGLNLTLQDNTTAVAYSSAVLPSPGISMHSVSLSFPRMNHTFSGYNLIRLVVVNDPTTTTDKVILEYNATTTPARVDVVTSTYVSVDTLVLRNAAGTPAYFTPMDTLTVQSRVSDPFGMAKIAAAYLNVTSSNGTRILNTGRMTAIQNDTGPYASWRLFTYSLGQAPPNGTYDVLVSAVEENGVVDLGNATAVVRAPDFAFTQKPSVLRATAGMAFAYQLWFNNSGTGPASMVWLNDTLPSSIDYLSAVWNSAGTYLGVTPIPGGYSWAWASVPSGSVNRLQINVQVAGNATQVASTRNEATVSYTDDNGHAWPSAESYADVILNGPLVYVAISSDPVGTIHANETVTFTVALTNAGDPAQNLWLNVTLPQGLFYLGDTSASLGGTSRIVGSVLEIGLTAMPPGAHWDLNVTLRADPLVPRGANLTVPFGLNYSSANGILMPSQSRAESLLVLAPFLTATSLALSTPQAASGEVFTVTIRFENTGNEAAHAAWINLSADLALKFVNASSPASVRYTGIALTISFALADLNVGPVAILMNLSVMPAAPDRHVATISGTIVYRDGFMNPMLPAGIPAGSVTVSAPAMALSVTPGIVIVESGTSQPFSVYVFNAGSGTAAEVWLNLSLPQSFDYVSDTSGAPRTVVGAVNSWHWRNQTPGSRAFSLVLGAKSFNPDGGSANLSFTLAYQDLNRDDRPTSSLTVRALFVAPVVVLGLKADRSDLSPGSTAVFTLSVTNKGNTTARWVSVRGGDSRFNVVAWEASVPASGNATKIWNFTDLAPGEVRTIKVTVSLVDGVPARTEIAQTYEALYSNSLGGASIGFVHSPAATITVAVDLTPLLYIGLAGVVAMPALAIYVARRSRVQIEEVFLVYRDGVLISHLSRTLLQDKDEDVLTGMLTAVQEFVRDAFQYGAHRELHQMDFGEYRILIERGRLAYLAVVYSGKNSGSVKKKVRDVLDRIEEAYGGVLETWDGDMEKVVGARDMIRDQLLGANGLVKGRKSSRNE